jgi:hypothetical protein
LNIAAALPKTYVTDQVNGDDNVWPTFDNNITFGRNNTL